MTGPARLCAWGGGSTGAHGKFGSTGAHGKFAFAYSPHSACAGRAVPLCGTDRGIAARESSRPAATHGLR